MATFNGTNNPDTANATGAGTLIGFSGGTIAELQDNIGDLFFGMDEADVVVAGPGPDSINGGEGNDTLDGGPGADGVLGLEGDDLLIGSPGADFLSGGGLFGSDPGGPSSDTVSYAGSPSGVFVQLPNIGVIGGTGLGGYAAGDTYFSIENIIGSSFGDILAGSNGPNAIDGGAGNDFIGGLAGNDELTGGEPETLFGDIGLGIDNFGQNQGWSSFDAFPRVLGDFDDDGSQDIAGFGATGTTFTAISNDDGTFAPIENGLNNLTQAQGWESHDQFPRMSGDFNFDNLANTNEDDDDDLIGFGDGFTYTALSNGDGTFADIEVAIENFTPAQGWTSQDQFPRIIGDFDGDGNDDIAGFGATGQTLISLSDGDGTFANPINGLADFTQAQGWTSFDLFPRLAGDVNGDGDDDLVGFGDGVTWVALSDGDGTFATPIIGTADFTPSQGWTSFNEFPRALDDVDGDGDADIIGFGDGITYVAFSKGDGTFADTIVGVEDYTPSQGWQDFNTFPRLAGDVTGDGKADIVGFTDVGTLVSESTADADTFVFGVGFGNDTITDFQIGSDIVLIDEATGVNDFGDLGIMNGPPAVVTVDTDGTITFTGINGSQLSATDFDFFT